MTTQQRIEAITKVINLHDKLDHEWDRLIKVIGTHDMPLFEVSWEVFDHAVSSVAKIVGDDFAWIAWFINENDCGRKGHPACAGYGDPRKPIRTIADLVALIEYKAP